MIHVVSLSWTLAKLPDFVAAELRSLVVSAGEPAAVRRLSLPFGHPALTRAVALLESAGLAAHQGSGRQQEFEYRITHTREWEQFDLDAAGYLWFYRALDTSEPVCFFDGDVPCLDIEHLRRIRRGLFGQHPLKCSDSMRRRLERGDFGRLTFVSVRLKQMNRSGPKSFLEDVHDLPPWWCLSSDYELPPMSPAIQRLVRQGPDTLVPRSRHERAPLVLHEPPFRDIQPRYLRSDWERVEPFDVAASYECVGVASGHLGRMLIVSKRFYEFCNREGIKADWVPVRIDPE